MVSTKMKDTDFLKKKTINKPDNTYNMVILFRVY